VHAVVLSVGRGGGEEEEGGGSVVRESQLCTDDEFYISSHQSLIS